MAANPNAVLHTIPSLVRDMALVHHYEADYPWPSGSRAAAYPGNVGRLTPGLSQPWREARVRILPRDFPVELKVREQFKTRHHRPMNRHEFAQWKAGVAQLLQNVEEGDQRALEAWEAGPRDKPHWPPVRPFPYEDEALDDIARPQRQWVLVFPDLRSVARAFAPPDPNTPGSIIPGPDRPDERKAMLQAIRYIQFTWMDDSRFHAWRQEPNQSEWAFEAMQNLYEAVQEMDREKLWIRIYFPRVPFRDPITSKLTTNSPGIFYLRRIRAQHLIIEQPRLVDERSVREPLKRDLLKQIQMTDDKKWKPWKPRGDELQDDEPQDDELRRNKFGVYPDFDITTYKEKTPRGGFRRLATRERLRLALLTRTYKTRHHRKNVNRKRFSHWVTKAKREVAQAAAGPAAVLQEKENELAWVRKTLVQLDRHWDSRDMYYEKQHHRGTPPQVPGYHIRPEQIG